MKCLLKFFLILAPFVGMAQDTLVTITPAMLDNEFNETFLNTKPGWVFKQGNDTTWARTDINTDDWQKLKLNDITEKYADKYGRVEGWFRIKIKFDSALVNQRLDLRWTTWAAADIYINGKFFFGYGNTGRNGKPFSESRIRLDVWPPDANLKAATKYTIAVHFVDYVSPFPPRQLKSQDATNGIALRITGSIGQALRLNFTTKGLLYFSIWASVCTILSILFWMLYFQNRAEKQLRLIAVCSTLFALVTYFLLLGLSNQSFIATYISSYAFGLLVELIFITIPIIFARIFNRSISRIFTALLVVLPLYTIVANFLPTAASIPVAVANVFLVAVCIYYIVSSWRRLHGAQWCIVVGLISVVAFSILIIALVEFVHSSLTAGRVLWLSTGFMLSFPLSMLAYVAVRFKEIIEEVRRNAHQVVLLSEEKREQAFNQQKILQNEVDSQTLEIRTTLNNLRSTQTQLIQSEKMASLGELTAGIAHEIQNPLNFVNNFSEVSVELLAELKEEEEKGNKDDVIAIADDLTQNLEKIRHHGKRAGAIVKGMLEHSRASTGQKEPTDINALADEYLRLSYHGLRAKDKTFNAEMITHFDEKLPQVSVIPQDIGRVLLNMYNNAFYAVNQKAKTTVPGYKPEVAVSTSLENGQVIIKVRDNGNGIPAAIRDKIMQPFFTTKPTGEGTGLGLSLSYDMVVKGHGGKIDIDTKEGEFSEFTITLPI